MARQNCVTGNNSVVLASRASTPPRLCLFPMVDESTGSEVTGTNQGDQRSCTLCNASRAFGLTAQRYGPENQRFGQLRLPGGQGVVNPVNQPCQPHASSHIGYAKHSSPDQSMSMPKRAAAGPVDARDGPALRLGDGGTPGLLPGEGELGCGENATLRLGNLTGDLVGENCGIVAGCEADGEARCQIPPELGVS